MPTELFSLPSPPAVRRVADSPPSMGGGDATPVPALTDAESAALELAPGRYAYVHVARGTLEVNGVRMQAGDGARVRQESRLDFGNGENAEVLVWDLRPNELPGH